MAEVELQEDGLSLKRRWLVLKDEEPGLRASDAARRLGVSEAELVAARCGEGVRRLDGPWFNVLDAGFNLHLREDGIVEAWVVRKPTRDGIVTSLEIYDASGEQIAWMFSERHDGEAELAAWRALVETLQPEGVAVQ